MTRLRDRALALALAGVVAAGAACGKYGKPERTKPTPPTVTVQPTAAPATATPPAEQCEPDAQKEKAAP
ncbi:MAG TPA: hypothetical protein VMS55_12370 [Myxococcota bacterium]|nr:hypothetical protein [Myxococcota bacterium]